MDPRELINYIKDSEKTTPVKIYLNAKEDIDFPNCQVFKMTENSKVIFGDWKDIEPVLKASKDKIDDHVIENNCRNTAIPMLDLKGINARIEPGAIIREQVEIGDNAVIMMGAVLNIGAKVGAGTMIDINAALGGRAEVGKNCHIAAGSIIAGVIEPPSATPVKIGDDVLVGANAVVLEGVQIGNGAVVAAGSIVINDVPAGAVVAGVPAKILKTADETDGNKIEIVQALREL